MQPRHVDDAGLTDLQRAEQLRRARDYSGAQMIYARLVQQQAMTADAWADYADVLASLHAGSLAGEPARYIAEALRADPNHPKALWLAGSLAHEQRRYADALAIWRKLSEVLGANSPDQRIIAQNIEEATRLAGRANAVASSSRAESVSLAGGQ
jgi:cytochrome c-type biogenesis protein CcmH